MSASVSGKQGSSGDFSDPCAVCSERGSKFHYGILACDGCKAFFRRSVRLKLQYECRQSRNCPIESGKRNICRFCRYQKCLHAGMKTQYVQNARDPISKRNRVISNTERPSQVVETLPSPSPTDVQIQKLENSEDLFRKMIHDDLVFARLTSTELSKFVSRNFLTFVAALRQLEEHCSQFFRKSRLLRQSQEPKAMKSGFGFEMATLEDVYNCCWTELIDMIHLVKQFRTFQSLPLVDKVALFRAHAIQWGLFNDIKRSLPFNDFILMNDERHVLPRDASQSISTVPGINSLIANLLDDIIAPFRRLEVDSTEMTCLCCISFWNADVCRDEVKDLVRNRQLCMLLILETYVNAKPLKVPGRYATLLMLLRSIQASAQRTLDKIQLSRIFDGFPSNNIFDDVYKDPMDPVGALGEQFSSPAAAAASGGPSHAWNSEVKVEEGRNVTTPLDTKSPASNGDDRMLSPPSVEDQTYSVLQPATPGADLQRAFQEEENLADWTVWNFL